MFRSISRFLLLFGVVLTSTGSGSLPIDRIEEDWELVIRSGDVVAAGPQITTTMCPGPVKDNPCANFNLNYRDGANFQAGGLQIEVFDAQALVAAATSNTESLQTDNETITWTQKMSISGGSATFRVQSGQSTTWGGFGGDGLTVTFPTALGDMSSYSSNISVEKSGVGWQADHVSSMRLMRVRYYSGATLVSTDSTPKVVLLSTSP